MLQRQALLLVCVILASLSSAIAETHFCVECGHDAQGCDAARKVTSWANLAGRDKNGRNSVRFFGTAPAVNKDTVESKYMAVFNNDDARYGFKFQLISENVADVDPNRLVLWLIADGATQRYYYLRGFGFCRGLWRHQKASDPNSLAVFVYQLP